METTGPLSAILLEPLLQRGSAAWPELAVPVPTFLQHLTTLIASRGDRGPPLAKLRAEDLYLACACAHGLAAAHAAFERECLTQVPVWLAGKDLPVPAQEVQQILRVRLLLAGPHGPPRIASYAGQGKLLSWVRIACAHLVADLHRERGALAQHTEMREPAAMDLLGRAVSPELEWMKAHYRQEFADAFRAALLSLSDEQRNLLRLHLVVGLSIDKLGPLFALSRATMARRLEAARRAILEETEHLLKDRLGVSADQVRSLAQLLRSQVDISLYTLLAQEKPVP